MSTLITTSKHIPILFSTPMVQALLAGRKTQTRRIIKDIPENTVSMIYDEASGWWKAKEAGAKNIHNMIKCPYGKPGDVLWVRETFTLDVDTFLWVYKAGPFIGNQINHWATEPIWKPSIHMPKDACRIFLEITGIRAEPLHRISPNDAVQEGIKRYQHHRYPLISYQDYAGKGVFTDPKDSYKSLWEMINGSESWNSNPWVWVLEFKQIEKPLNF
jgi:hypothetical protein